MNLLATKKYNGKQSEAQRRIFLIITHEDMFDQEVNILLKTKIRSALYNCNIPPNFAYFGGKECEWDQKDLEAHETEVAEFFEKVPRDQDWQDYYTSTPPPPHQCKPSKFPHIDEWKCKKPSCQHNWTAETVKNFRECLSSILAY